jgi:hypothetical protein
MRFCAQVGPDKGAVVMLEQPTLRFFENKEHESNGGNDRYQPLIRNQ